MSLTIYDIKYATLKNSPYFFDRKTMNFFGQKMNNFKVVTSYSGNVYIYALRRFWDRDTNKYIKSGYTIRQFTGNDLIDVELPLYVENFSREELKRFLKNY